ncbi:MAG: tetratricopeptide repeat protein [Gemmatimonadota bacterium]|nr:tetratricopeptide repeat protein [Gemmatimonadota bacterium]
MSTLSIRRRAVAVLVLLLATAGPVTAQEPGPLQKSDIVRLLATGGEDQGAIARSIRERCLTFTPNARDYDDFRRVGASDEVIGALRSCATQAAAPAELRVPSSVVTVRAGGTARLSATAIRDGRPAQGVRVVVRGSGRLPRGGGRDLEAVSGPDGSVSFTLQAGTAAAGFDLVLAAPDAGDIGERPVRLRVVPAPADAAEGLPAASPADEILSFAAVLRDRFGNPVPGASVILRAGAAADGDVLFEGTSDANGTVRVTVPPVRVAGLERVSLFGPAGLLGTVRIEPGAPVVQQVVFVAGAEQTAEAGREFPRPVVVEARDAEDRPVPGTEIRLSAEDGTLAAADSVTDARGQARARVVAGARSWETVVRAEAGEAVASLPLAVTRGGLTERDLAALVARADSLVAAGRPVEAVPLFERALAVDPGRLEARLGLAEAAAGLDDLARAEEEYREVLRISSGSRRAQLGLARVLEARGRPGDAATWYQLALGRSPEDVETWVALGNARLAAGEPGGARDAFRRALDLDPGNAVARAGLGRTGPGEAVFRAAVWAGNTYDNTRDAGLRHADVEIVPARWITLRGTFDNTLGLRHPWLVRGDTDMESFYGAVSVRWGRTRSLETTFEAGRRDQPGEEDVYQSSWLLSQGFRLSPVSRLEIGGWLGRWFDRDDWSVFGSAHLGIGPRLALVPTLSIGDHSGTNISGDPGRPGSGREAETEVRAGLGLRYETPAWGIQPALAVGGVTDDREDEAFEGTLFDATTRLWVAVGRVARLQGFVRYQSPPGLDSFWTVALGLGIAVAGGG